MMSRASAKPAKFLRKVCQVEAVRGDDEVVVLMLLGSEAQARQLEEVRRLLLHKSS